MRPSFSITLPCNPVRTIATSLRTISSSNTSPGTSTTPVWVRERPASFFASKVKLPRGTPAKAKRPFSSAKTPRPCSRESGSGKRFTAAPFTALTPLGPNTIPSTNPRPRKRNAIGTSVPSLIESSFTRSRTNARSKPSAAATALGKAPRAKLSSKVFCTLAWEANSNSLSRAISPSREDSNIMSTASSESPEVSVDEIEYGTPAKTKSKVKNPDSFEKTCATRTIKGTHPNRPFSFSSL